LLSEDGLRSFWSPHFANREGAVAFEHWPPLRLDLHLAAVRIGDEVAVVTHRQDTAYAAVSGEQLGSVDADITPLRAEAYKTLTVLVSQRKEGARWSTILRTDTDRLGKPTSDKLWRFDGLYVSRALLDRTGDVVLFKSGSDWYLCKKSSKPTLTTIPAEFEPWAMDISEDVVVGRQGKGLAIVSVSKGTVQKLVDPPPTVGGRATTFFASALLDGGRTIVSFRVDEPSVERERVSLYEVGPAGEPKYLGPFELQGASNRGGVLLLGRGVSEATSLIVWPK
jgi:hypothetical protein